MIYLRMSNIRRQSIISSVIVYFGFALGLVNTYLYTKEGHFTESQYGLVSTFIAIANIMLSFANLGLSISGDAVGNWSKLAFSNGL